LLELIEKVELLVPPAEREIFAGLKDRLRPNAELEAERMMIPEKLLTLVRVMVDTEDAPASIVKLDRSADMLKSDWLTLTVFVADELCPAESCAVKRTR